MSAAFAAAMDQRVAIIPVALVKVVVQGLVSLKAPITIIAAAAVRFVLVLNTAVAAPVLVVQGLGVNHQSRMFLYVVVLLNTAVAALKYRNVRKILAVEAFRQEDKAVPIMRRRATTLLILMFQAAIQPLVPIHALLAIVGTAVLARLTVPRLIPAAIVPPALAVVTVLAMGR